MDRVGLLESSAVISAHALRRVANRIAIVHIAVVQAAYGARLCWVRIIDRCRADRGIALVLANTVVPSAPPAAERARHEARALAAHLTLILRQRCAGRRARLHPAHALALEGAGSAVAGAGGRAALSAVQGRQSVPAAPLGRARVEIDSCRRHQPRNARHAASGAATAPRSGTSRATSPRARARRAAPRRARCSAVAGAARSKAKQRCKPEKVPAHDHPDDHAPDDTRFAPEI